MIKRTSKFSDSDLDALFNLTLTYLENGICTERLEAIKNIATIAIKKEEAIQNYIEHTKVRE